MEHKTHQPEEAATTSSKTSLRRTYFLLFVGLLSLTALLIGTGCNEGCSESPGLLTSTSGVSHRAAVDVANPEILNIWVDIKESGVYSPTLALAEGNDEIQGLPSYLDELAGNGYLAIRVPHAPPTYAASRLIPGTQGSANAVEFRYYMPPDSPAAITIPISITRMTAYEDAVNALYPINDGRSHWEVWWIGADRFPIPSDTFRLKKEWPQAIEVQFQIDFGEGTHATDCADCSLEMLVYNGYTFIGPTDIPLVIEGAPSSQAPLVAFDQGCPEGDATYLQNISPSAPFTQTHWLGNFDTVARTFRITADSSQGWDYAYYYGQSGQPLQLAPEPPFTISVQPGQPGGWPPPPCVAITAVYTPSITLTESLRETLRITATDVISPGIWADTASYALTPGYQLDEEGNPFKLYAPLMIK